jgi:putative hemolysin
MIGCASLPGVDPAAHATALAVLGRHAATGDEWSVRALPDRRADLDLPDVRANDMRRALAGLPPLVKGYLRLGARFGADAVVDRAFGTTDVFVVMPVADIDARYIEHFTGAAMEAAAA